MSNGAYAGLRMAARATNPEPGDNPANEPGDDGNEGNPPKGKKKDDESMTTEASAAAIAAAEQTGESKGALAANKRFSAVLASEHYAGREKLAAKLLDNFSLSADDIIGALAEAPAGGAQASNAEAAEEAGRKEMQAALAGNANSNIDPDGGGDGKNKEQNAASLWAQAQASLNPRGRQ